MGSSLLCLTLNHTHLASCLIKKYRLVNRYTLQHHHRQPLKKSDAISGNLINLERIFKYIQTLKAPQSIPVAFFLDEPFIVQDLHNEQKEVIHTRSFQTNFSDIIPSSLWYQCMIKQTTLIGLTYLSLKLKLNIITITSFLQAQILFAQNQKKLISSENYTSLQDINAFLGYYFDGQQSLLSQILMIPEGYDISSQEHAAYASMCKN